MKEKNIHPDKKQPDPLLQPLDIFKGEWKVRGKNFPSAPEAGEQKVKGTVKYQWLKGKFFLVGMWNRKFGDLRHVGTGIIGYDAERNILSADNFDNLGFHRKYLVHSEDGIIWRFSGDKERAFISFSADGESFIEYWEAVADNGEWKPLCRLKANKR